MLKSIVIGACFMLGIGTIGDHYLKTPKEYPLPEPKAHQVDLEYLKMTTDAYISLSRRDSEASKEFENLTLANSYIFDAKQISRQIKKKNKLR